MKDNIKNKTCCFTGHRIMTDNHIIVKEKLKTEILKLINNGVCYFGTGGAIGFDTIAALTILELRQTYTHIKLILVLPCPEQDKYWNDKDKRIYAKIKEQADKITFISNHYTKQCMFIRNRWLVDNSGYCITYCNSSIGGTAYTVKYALSKNVKIINLCELL